MFSLVSLRLFIFQHTVFFSFLVPNILLAAGFSYLGVKATSEIINLENEDSSCSDLKDYPFDTSNAVGSNLGSIPVVCGGSYR